MLLYRQKDIAKMFYISLATFQRVFAKKLNPIRTYPGTKYCKAHYPKSEVIKFIDLRYPKISSKQKRELIKRLDELHERTGK